jgi:hypothetical protein
MSEMDSISGKEFKKNMIVRMFNEIKEIQKALRIQSTQDQKKKKNLLWAYYN